jgi:hypothetical protein
MHIIAGLIALGLLFAFPRTMVALAAFAAMALGIFIWRDSAESSRRAREEAEVIITAYPTVPAPGCPNGFPISVAFANHSQRTVTEISWKLEVRRKGYSSNLIDYFDASRTSDKILKPNDFIAFCYSIPKLSSPVQQSELEILALRIYSTFAE